MDISKCALTDHRQKSAAGDRTWLFVTAQCQFPTALRECQAGVARPGRWVHQGLVHGVPPDTCAAPLSRPAE